MRRRRGRSRRPDATGSWTSDQARSPARTPDTMSPPNAENDPVHQGLARTGPAGGPGVPPPAADPADNPVERGLHELGRQIDEADSGAADGRGRRRGARARRRPTAPFPAPDGGLRAGHARAGDRPPGRGDCRLRLVPQPRDPPDRSPQPHLGPGQGRGRGHGEHLDDRLHLALRPDRAEPGLRAVLAGGQRGQQRRGDDPPPQPGQPHALHPLHPPRPVRAQRALRRRQQDRRRALPGARPTDRRHRGGLRHSDPALRGAELRQLHQRGQRAGRDQDVLPRAGLRRLLGAEHPDDGLPPAQRHPGPPGGPGPSRAVQGTRASPPTIRATGRRRRRATSPGSGATTSSSASWPPRSRRRASATR